MKKLIFLFLLFRACTPLPAQSVDTLEFLPGYPNLTNAPTAIEQLTNYPAPRYKLGHTLKPHFNNIEPVYHAGYQQPGTPDIVVRTNSVALQSVMAGKFNCMLRLTWLDNAYNDTCVALANRNPQWKVSIMILRSQIQSYIDKQDFPDNHYLQNSAGKFLDINGSITSAPYKIWRPTAPLASYTRDGQLVRGFMDAVLRNLTRPVNYLCENDEVYPIITPDAMRADPIVNAAINSTPIPNPDNDPIQVPGLYLGTKLVSIDSAYRVQIMAHPRLTNAIYSEYRLGGNKAFNYNWNTVRKIQSQVNGQYYPSDDFYVRTPNNWATWSGPWHGLSFLSHGIFEQLKLGDKLTSYWIAAGYECDISTIVLSAQWLGLLKIHGVWGAEYFHLGYFNEDPSKCPVPEGQDRIPNDPKGYTYQAAIPSYAQAISSRYEDILRNGTLMEGDMPDNTYAMKNPIPSYRFNAGQSNKVIAIRAKDSVYVITGTIQNNDNIKGSTPLNSTATFTLSGTAYTINIRRQGSTYILDLTNIGDPVFYQLDGWHEASHPWRWSKDWNCEAENYESSTGKLRTYPITTYPDLRQFKTFVMLNTNENANYNFETSGVKYLFIKSSGNGNLNVDVDVNKYVIGTSAEGWYKVSLGSLSSATHSLILKSGSYHEVDSICITTDPNKYQVVTPTTPCEYVYSAWGSCVNGTQTRTVVSAEPPNCYGVPVVSQSCTTTCTPPLNLTYSPRTKGVIINWDKTAGKGFEVNIWAVNGSNTVEKNFKNPNFTGGQFLGLFGGTTYMMVVGNVCSDGSVMESAVIQFETP